MRRAAVPRVTGLSGRRLLLDMSAVAGELLAGAAHLLPPVQPIEVRFTSDDDYFPEGVSSGRSGIILIGSIVRSPSNGSWVPRASRILGGRPGRAKHRSEP